MLREALSAAARRLEAAGCENPQLDARLLLGSALGLSAEQMIASPETPLTPQAERRFLSLVERRENREPVSHLLGAREFWGRTFSVSADVLTPRPDSETLIEAVLTHFPDREAPYEILDLGTGSGCLLLTLLAEYPNARGTGVDISEAALSVARANAKALKLLPRADFLPSDWCAALGQKKYQIIVANPPYIASNGVRILMPEVALYEPLQALDGGEDGLNCYRRIAQDLKPQVSKQNKVFLEVGAGQNEAVAQIFSEADWRVDSVRNDLAGIARCIIVTFQL